MFNMTFWVVLVHLYLHIFLGIHSINSAQNIFSSNMDHNSFPHPASLEISGSGARNHIKWFSKLRLGLVRQFFVCHLRRLNLSTGWDRSYWICRAILEKGCWANDKRLFDVCVRKFKNHTVESVEIPNIFWNSLRIWFMLTARCAPARFHIGFPSRAP